MHRAFMTNTVWTLHLLWRGSVFHVLHVLFPFFLLLISFDVHPLAVPKLTLLHSHSDFNFVGNILGNFLPWQISLLVSWWSVSCFDVASETVFEGFVMITVVHVKGWV